MGTAVALSSLWAERLRQTALERVIRSDFGYQGRRPVIATREPKFVKDSQFGKAGFIKKTEKSAGPTTECDVRDWVN